MFRTKVLLIETDPAIALGLPELISQSLGITYHTVRSHICAIRNKLVAKSKLEMVNKCWNMGLVYEL